MAAPVLDSNYIRESDMKRLFFLLLVAVSSSVMANDRIKIDQTFCNARALLGKAGAEARDRKTPLSEWRRELTFLKVYGSKESLLTVAASTGIYDADNIYGTSRTLSPVEVYTTFYRSCMQLEGSTLSLL